MIEEGPVRHKSEDDQSIVKSVDTLSGLVLTVLAVSLLLASAVTVALLIYFWTSAGSGHP